MLFQRLEDGTGRNGGGDGLEVEQKPEFEHGRGNGNAPEGLFRRTGIGPRQKGVPLFLGPAVAVADGPLFVIRADCATVVLEAGENFVRPKFRGNLGVKRREMHWETRGFDDFSSAKMYPCKSVVYD